MFLWMIENVMLLLWGSDTWSFTPGSVTPIESLYLPESWIKTASHTTILLRPILARRLLIWMVKFLILSSNYCLEI
jgi:hypothetical protein